MGNLYTNPEGCQGQPRVLSISIAPSLFDHCVTRITLRRDFSSLKERGALISWLVSGGARAWAQVF